MISIFNPLSTLQASLDARLNVERMQAQMQTASQELSTGMRADVYGDLGQTAAIPLGLRGQSDQTDALVTSNKLLGNKMDVIATTLGRIHDTVQPVMGDAVSNLDQPGATAPTLQVRARAALDALTNALNTGFAGEFIFAGTSTDRPPMQGWDQTNAATGLSPQGAMQAMVAGGPTSASDAASKIAEIRAAYNSADTANPNRNYEATFYNGTPATNAAGNPNARVTAHIDTNDTITYGVQANDAPMRDLMRGLSMLASTDVSKIKDGAAYKAWMNEAVSALTSGMDGLRQEQTTLGSQQQLVQQTMTRQGDLKSVLNSRILGYEAVDPYTAASRLSALRNQLDATYSATATLGKLSILNYL